MSDTPSVLVTGAAKRIGRFIACAFARRGWHVGLHYNSSADEAAACKQEIEALGGSTSLMPCDLADPDAVGALIEQAGTLNNWQALVNSAAIFERDRTATLTHESWNRHQMINLEAPLRLSQAFARQVDPQANNLIINVIDAKVLRPNQHYLSYSVAKSGLWYLTQAQALDLAPTVRVNAIGPGPTLVAPGQSDEVFEKMVAKQPLQRAPDADEFDATVGFLLAARSVTGQMIALDGGNHLGWQHVERVQPV